VKNNKKSSLFRTCLILACCVLVIVAAAVIAQKVRQENAFDRGGEIRQFYYDASQNAVFESVGDHLAVFSAADLTVYGSDGSVELREYCHVAKPAIISCGSYAAAYDIGGQWLCFFSSEGVIKTMDSGENIISASVDTDGYLTVCTEDSGYFGAVEIYDAEGEAIYRWRSGTAYVLAARTGGNGFSAAVLGRGGSRVVRYAFNSEEEKGRFETAELVIDLLRFKNSTGVLTRSEMIYLDENGAETGRYDFSDSYLEMYAGGNGYAVLVTGDYQLASDRSISVLEEDGTVSASIHAEADVVDIAAHGDYVAVLYKEKAVLYGRDLGKLWETADLSGETAITVTEEGNVYTAGIYSARSHKNQTQ